MLTAHLLRCSTTSQIRTEQPSCSTIVNVMHALADVPYQSPCIRMGRMVTSITWHLFDEVCDEGLSSSAVASSKIAGCRARTSRPHPFHLFFIQASLCKYPLDFLEYRLVAPCYRHGQTLCSRKVTKSYRIFPLPERIHLVATFSLDCRSCPEPSVPNTRLGTSSIYHLPPGID